MTGSILVTGANGLVGRALLARLGDTRRVYALVRKQPQSPLPGGAELVIHDLCRRTNPELSESPRVIVHLAQSPRYRDFPEGAADVFDVNVGSTQRLLDWACRLGVKCFVYASSGGVYGSGDNAFEEDVFFENSTCLGHYLITKRCGELLTEAYRSQMIVVVLRFFFVYGPGQRQTMLIPRLINNVMQDCPIVLQGEDGIRLNPVYVDDAAAAIEAAVNLERSETINVAGPEVLTLREIGMLVGRALGRKPIFERQLDKEPKHIIGGTDKMARLLGQAKIPMAEGIKRMIAADSEASVRKPNR